MPNRSQPPHEEPSRTSGFGDLVGAWIRRDLPVLVALGGFVLLLMQTVDRKRELDAAQQQLDQSRARVENSRALAESARREVQKLSSEMGRARDERAGATSRVRALDGEPVGSRAR